MPSSAGKAMSGEGTTDVISFALFLHRRQIHSTRNCPMPGQTNLGAQMVLAACPTVGNFGGFGKYVMDEYNENHILF